MFRSYSRHSRDSGDVVVEAGGHQVYEDMMVTMERYRQAVHDEMGILNTVIALTVFRDNPELCEETPKVCEEFIEQSLKFLTGRLSFTENEQEREKLQKVKSVLESLQKMEKGVDVEEGLSVLESISKAISPNVSEARDHYYRTLKHY